MGEGRISVVIVTYNSADWIETCLDHLDASELDGYGLEVVVVDNASRDNCQATFRIERVYSASVMPRTSDSRRP